MAESNSKKSGGIGILGATFIVFLILKLTEVGVVATWSWWWVTCPLWIMPAIYASFFVAYFFLLIMSTLVKKKPVNQEEDPTIKKSSFQQKLEERMEKLRGKENNN